MVVRRGSSVAVAARAAARERRSTAQAARREREQRIDALADEHAVALAMADEVRARAVEQIAEHQAKADRKVVELLELEGRAAAVADLLGMTVPEVRAARKRANVRDAGEPAEAGQITGDGADSATETAGGAGSAVPRQRSGVDAPAEV
ncbi:hypothetical protein [Actinoplanes sp. NPDC051851]|uniref:hypothetical protein n=1 Tax=Actinoplanes sp. NPDC051851 TaxID=3154753 RepID=UPI003421A3E2